MRKISAFTLAETMIALVVLGVIMAMVLPTIMNSMPNKNKMMIKKAYYTTENIIHELINDNNLYPDNSIFCNTKYDDDGYAIAGTGITDPECYFGFDDDRKVQYNGVDYSGASKFAELFREKLNYKTKESDYKFTTNDGIIWDLSGTNTVWAKNTKPENNVKTITIDVNGTEEPNCLQSACKNPNNFDQFRIDIRSDGKISINAADTNAQEFITVSSKISE